MAALRVSLLGRFAVSCDDASLEPIDSRKAQELFCYLLLHRAHPQPRETLASLLWGETTTAQSKSYLRKALWQLQSLLGRVVCSERERIVLAEGDAVQLNHRADLWLDVAEFEGAYQRVGNLPVHDLDAACVRCLTNAVTLYQGELLPGCYQEWCLFERERLHQMHLSMLDRLIDYAEGQHDYEAGLAYGSRALACDRARESAHRRMMRLYCLDGDRSMALRQYEKCAEALQEELGVRPSKATQMLFAQIQADQLTPQPAAVLPSRPQCRTDDLSGILARLEHLNKVLSEAQHVVQQDMQAVREVLSERGSRG